jgi:hypothetical protein
MLTHSWRFAIVRKLQDVDHILALLFENMLPRDIGHVTQTRAHGIVIILPSYSLKNRIRRRQRLQLELRRNWKVVSRQNLFGLLLLLRVSFPLDISLPSLALLGKQREFALDFKRFVVRLSRCHCEMSNDQTFDVKIEYCRTLARDRYPVFIRHHPSSKS